MEKKYSNLLLSIFFILIFSLYCLSCKNSGNNKNEHATNDLSVDIPDTVIYDFSYRFTRGDQMVWELFSKKASVFSKQSIKKIDGVDLKFYKNNRIDSILISRFGEHDEREGLLTAISNVVLTTEDGTVLYTEILHWDDKRSLLFTKEFVRILKKNGAIITAIGMEADNRLEKVLFKSRVKGEFYEQK